MKKNLLVVNGIGLYRNLKNTTIYPSYIKDQL